MTKFGLTGAANSPSEDAEILVDYKYMEISESIQILKTLGHTQLLEEDCCAMIEAILHGV